MNKIKRLFAFLFVFLGVLSLASCAKSFEGTIENLIATRDTITVEVEFESDKEITSGRAVPYVKIFKVNEKDESYIDDDKNIELNTRKDAGTAVFSKLNPGQEYKIYLYMKYNGSETKLGEGKSVTTLKNGTSEDDPVLISTADDFLKMQVDENGYYKLANDIDFEKAQLTEQFTSSKPFKGHFDGNGKTISNFSIKSASNSGIFGQAEGATIKNLNIESPEIDFSSGRSSANIGVLVGRAINCNISDINISNAKVTVSANSSAEINLAVLIGLSENTSVKNVKITNADMNLTRSRLKVSAGLAFGMLKGSVLSDVFVQNVYVDGKIMANAYYNSTTEGSTYIGGFAGNLGATGLVKDCASKVAITVTKEVNDNYSYDFDMAIGGFIGMNNQGSMNVLGCAAIADIKVYAGKLPAENSNNESLLNDQMSKKPIYVGGFIGRAKRRFLGIEDSTYVKLNDGIEVWALESKTEEEKTTKFVYKGDFVGDTDAMDKIINCINPTKEVVWDKTVKEMIDSVKKA